LSVGVAETVSGVHLKSLQFGAASNALIDVPGMPPGLTGNVTVPVTGLAQASFTIRQRTVGGYTTVPYTIVDDCALVWPTFAGGGPSAFVTTTTNVAPPPPSPVPPAPAPPAPAPPAPAPPSGTRGQGSVPAVTRVDITSGAPSGGGAAGAAPVVVPRVSLQPLSVPVVVDVPPPVVVDMTPALVVADPPAVVVDDSVDNASVSSDVTSPDDPSLGDTVGPDPSISEPPDDLPPPDDN
jgi:hypothetical protein